jgi:hypothetical protein
MVVPFNVCPQVMGIALQIKSLAGITGAGQLTHVIVASHPGLTTEISVVKLKVRHPVEEVKTGGKVVPE